MIEKEEVEKISNLARIKLTKEEIILMQKDLSNILDYFNLLKEVDVSNVSPFSFSYLNSNILREDNREEKKERAKDSFPQKKDNYLKVKEIF